MRRNEIINLRQRPTTYADLPSFATTAWPFWFAKGEAERKVAAKPLATFKQRVRQLTRRSGGHGRVEALPHGIESLFRAGANAKHLALAG